MCSTTDPENENINNSLMYFYLVIMLIIGILLIIFSIYILFYSNQKIINNLSPSNPQDYFYQQGQVLSHQPVQVQPTQVLSSQPSQVLSSQPAQVLSSKIVTPSQISNNLANSFSTL